MWKILEINTKDINYDFGRFYGNIAGLRKILENKTNNCHYSGKVVEIWEEILTIVENFTNLKGEK